MNPLAERAPAKINLSLAILGRRPDGFHDLDSLVAFARDAFDELTLAPADALSLVVAGPTANDTGRIDDNLVMKAARAVAERKAGLRLGAFSLIKRLPVAAGVGGGSADAAAALRLLARLNDLSPDDPALFDAARATGADVLVCLAARARRMQGIGDELGPSIPLPPLHALLVNPGVACPTGAVFREWGALHPTPASLRSADPGTRPGQAPPPQGEGESRVFLDWLASQSNDLEAPAVRLVPAIADVLAALRATNPALARMSGSGATCFALYPDRAGALRAEAHVKLSRPLWWTATTQLD